MKTIEKIRSIALGFAPWIIGVTIILGSVMVIPNMAYNYANSKSIFIEIGFAIIIAIGLISIPTQTIKNLFKSKVVWGATAFLLASFISTLFSIDKVLSWYGHLERGTGLFFLLVVAIGAIISIILAYQTNMFRNAILYPISIAGSVIGLSTIIGFTGFNLTNWLVLGQVSGGGGLTGNSSFAGSFLIMTAFVTLYLFVTTQSKNKKIFLAILGILTVLNPVIIEYNVFRSGPTITGLVDFLGDARGAAVSLAFGLLTALGIGLSYSGKKILKYGGRLLAGTMITLTVLGIVLVVIPNNRVHNAFISNASGTRFLYWDIALKATKEHPVLGTGPETFRYAHEKYFNPDFMRKSFKRELYTDKPHNAYLEILSTTGVVGSLAYLSMIGFAIFTLARLSKKRENRIMVAMVSGLLFAYLVNNFILFDIPQTLLLLFLILSWLAMEEIKEKWVGTPAISQDSMVGFTVRSGLGLAAVMVIFVIVFPQIKKMNIVLDEMYAPLENRPEMYQKSEEASPYGSGVTLGQRVDVYTQNYLSHLNDIFTSDEKSQKLVLDDVHALIDVLNTSFAKYPATTQSWVNMGRLGSLQIILTGKADPAYIKRMMDSGAKIKELSPRNPQAYWIIGQAYMYQGKYQEALDAFNEGLALNVHVPESHQVIIQLAQVTGNKALLAKAMTDYERDVLPEDR
jgi:tetratricopeptide (TPR) repeat protein